MSCERPLPKSIQDGQPKIPALSGFIEGELNRMKDLDRFAERPRPDFESLNELFRRALQTVG